MTSGMEKLTYSFPGTRRAPAFAPILVGVVASGNLEILVEPIDADECRYRVETSARGFGDIWAAVVQDFHDKHGLAGAAISIHDMGATPAVVSLRLEQAAAALTGAQP